MGVSKSFMSKTFYLNCPSLHLYQNLCQGQNILDDNGQYVCVLFVIPVMINLHGDRFEMHTLDSEIHDNFGHGNENKKCV